MKKTVLLQLKQPKTFLPLIILVIMLILPKVVNFNLTSFSIVISVLLYMYWASAWNILGGYAGLFSLGSGIFIGLGAYIVASLYTYAGVSPWFGLIIAGVVVGLFSLLIGYPTFKLQALYYSLATCALLSVMKLIFVNFKKVLGVTTGGADGFKINAKEFSFASMQFSSKEPYYYIILSLLVVVLLVSLYISKTKTGYYFRGIANNAEASASLGVNVLKMKMMAQFVSAFFLAVGGGFYCMFISMISPTSVFGIDISINIMIMCVVGGSNTLWGPLIGAALLYFVDRMATLYLSTIVPDLSSLVFGVILLIVVYFFPGGIMGQIAELRAKRNAQKLEASNESGKEAV